MTTTRSALTPTSCGPVRAAPTSSRRSRLKSCCTSALRWWARPVGERWGMRHFDVQLIGGMVLNDGAIAEMRTGEGKTLTATPRWCCNLAPGRGVHVVTVNDDLARRDALWMKPIYDMLGVSVGILQKMQSSEEKAGCIRLPT